MKSFKINEIKDAFSTLVYSGDIDEVIREYSKDYSTDFDLNKYKGIYL